MGYAAREGHALVGARLYLPREWTRDRARCRKAGIPRGVRFRTRHAMALEMLGERGALLPHTWIAGDDEMGRVTWFRRALRDRRERYLLAVPSDTLVRDLDGRRPAYRGHGPRPKRKFERVDRLASRWPASERTTVDVRDGEKGPLVVEITTRRVVARLEHSRLQSTEELLVVMRSPDEGGGMRTDYYLSNAAADTPRAELARVAKAEHRIEECIKRAKSEAGLADYEVRNWPGWNHHQALSLIVTWFLVQEAQRGKKVDPGDHRAHGPQPAVGAVA
jgi:SRSO17 transposase